jgi:hypothetical protein
MSHNLKTPRTIISIESQGPPLVTLHYLLSRVSFSLYCYQKTLSLKVMFPNHTFSSFSRPSSSLQSHISCATNPIKYPELQVNQQIKRYSHWRNAYKALYKCMQNVVSIGGITSLSRRTTTLVCSRREHVERILLYDSMTSVETCGVGYKLNPSLDFVFT